jgi:hypothetical protein
MSENMQGWITLIIYFSIWALILVVPFWFIFKKAGFNPKLSLLMFVPVANLITLCYLIIQKDNQLKLLDKHIKWYAEILARLILFKRISAKSNINQLQTLGRFLIQPFFVLATPKRPKADGVA